MTTPTVNAQPVIDAVRSAVTAAGVPFGDSKMPTRDGTKPWVVAWFDPGTVGARTMRGGDGWSTVGTFHCYGLTADSARIAARIVADAVRGLRGAPAAGRAITITEQLTSLPVSRDDAVNPPTYDAIVEWRLTLT